MEKEEYFFIPCRKIFGLSLKLLFVRYLIIFQYMYFTCMRVFKLSPIFVLMNFKV